ENQIIKYFHNFYTIGDIKGKYLLLQFITKNYPVPPERNQFGVVVSWWFAIKRSWRWKAVSLLSNYCVAFS
ncbi:MAG: hypothetical protein QF864_09800, partial [SAR202 cluster bacterium]|nr:hypothetical protein [SAR202 cluster bacterium]